MSKTDFANMMMALLTMRQFLTTEGVDERQIRELTTELARWVDCLSRARKHPAMAGGRRQ